MGIKLGFSSLAWNFSLVENNPIYKAFDSKLSYQSKDDINDISKNLKVKELDTKVEEAQKELKTVFFRDPITNKIVQSALSENTLSILKDKLGGVYKKDDYYILSNKAESFVSGWYADIAYQRGYIKADSNDDGYLTKDELDETRSGYTTHGIASIRDGLVIRSDILATESYIKLGGYSTAYDGVLHNFEAREKTFYNNGKFAKETIALELERTIQSDKDLNGVLQYKELMSFEEMKQQWMDAINYAVTGSSDFFKTVWELSEEVSAIYSTVMEDFVKELQLLEKLKEKGYESLNKDEKEYLLKTYPNLFNENKEFKKENFDSFYEDFKTDFVNKSKDFLGLKDEENLNLSFDDLSLVMKEIFSNIASVNISNPFYKKRFVDLEV